MADGKNVPDQEILQCVANGIRAARKAKKWSQKALASRVGVDEKTIRNYETLASPPDILVLKKIADATGKDLPFVLQLEIEKPDPHEESRAKKGASATTPEKVAKKGSNKLVRKDERPPGESAEFLGGYFEVGKNKITIDIIVRGPEERARLGGYGEEGSEDSE